MQFLVYSAPATGRAWNYELATPDGHRPCITGVADASTNATLLHIAFQAAASGQWMHVVYEARAGVFDAPQLVRAAKRMPGGFEVPRELSGWSAAGRLVLASDSGDAYALLELDAARVELSLRASGRVADGARYAAMGLAVVSTDGAAHVAVRVAATAACAARVSAYAVAGGVLSPIAPDTGTVCIDGGAVAPPDVRWLAVAAAPSSGAEIDGCRADRLVVLVALGTRNGTVYTGHACVDRDAGVLHAPNNSRTLVLRGVGTRPTVALHAAGADAGGARFAVLQADAYCWNSFAHNTRADVAVCAAQPTSTPLVLAYSYGRLRSLASSSAPLTACSVDPLHGVYDTGRAPWPVLLRDAAGAWALGALHEGIDAPAPATRNCGVAVSRPGRLVLDAWPIGR